MALTREERKLLHQKGKQPTFGINEPDAREGHDGDISFRQVENSGTVQYVKKNGDWLPMSSSGNMPSSRSIQSSSSTSGGVTDHSDLSSLGVDDHPQYLLINGSRAMSGDLSLSGGDGALTFTADNSSIKIPDDKASSLVIEEADNAYITITTTNSSEKITLYEDLYINDGSNNIFHFDQSLAQMYIYDDSDVSNYMKMQVLTGGPTKLTTVDADGSVAHFTMDIDGDIVLDAASGNTLLELNGTTYGTFILNSNNIEFDVELGNLTLDVAGDIYLDAAGDHIYFADAGDTRIRFTLDPSPDLKSYGDFTLDSTGNIILSAEDASVRISDDDIVYIDIHNTDSTPEIDVTGNFTIDGSGTIDIDSASTLTLNGTSAVNIQENGTNVINIDTHRYIYFNAYAQTLYQQYGFHNKIDKYHQTSGKDDYDQNYSILSESIVSSSYNTNYGG